MKTHPNVARRKGVEISLIQGVDDLYGFLRRAAKLLKYGVDQLHLLFLEDFLVTRKHEPFDVVDLNWRLDESVFELLAAKNRIEHVCDVT